MVCFDSPLWVHVMQSCAQVGLAVISLTRFLQSEVLFCCWSKPSQMATTQWLQLMLQACLNMQWLITGKYAGHKNICCKVHRSWSHITRDQGKVSIDHGACACVVLVRYESVYLWDNMHQVCTRFTCSDHKVPSHPPSNIVYINTEPQALQKLNNVTE